MTPSHESRINMCAVHATHSTTMTIPVTAAAIDKTRATAQIIQADVGSDAFQNLVTSLSNSVSSSSGTTASSIDHNALINIMQRYESHRPSWQKYAFGDNSRAYTRNLIDEGKGRSNLMILVWSPGKESPIHDHADAHCVMKVCSCLGR